MRTPKEIYREYRIVPMLQLHQLRVAAVGKLICDHFRAPVDTDTVSLACLFHDMGNIIKSDLSIFPDAVQPEGLPYWQDVKREFHLRYGDDSHQANVLIARELGLPEHVIKIIDTIGFSRMRLIVDEQAAEPKVAEYADLRVGPFGVLSMTDRLTEAKQRYDAKIRRKGYYESEDEFQRLSSAAAELEGQLTSLCSIDPRSIDNIQVAPVIKELWEYPVP